MRGLNQGIKKSELITLGDMSKWQTLAQLQGGRVVVSGKTFKTGSPPEQRWASQISHEPCPNGDSPHLARTPTILPPMNAKEAQADTLKKNNTKCAQTHFFQIYSFEYFAGSPSTLAAELVT